MTKMKRMTGLKTNKKMMMNNMKKITAVILAVLMIAVSVAGCSKDFVGSASGDKAGNATGSAGGGTVTLKVWGSQEDQQMLGDMIDAFKAANTGKTYDISLGVIGEGDAKSRYLDDPAAAADVFAFANDQIHDLVNAGALYRITRNKDEIVKANNEGSIEAATIGNDLYAYPMTADNGYFLYYDKSVLSDEDVKTLDGILKKCGAAGKKMHMDIANGWYIASFFLGAGCTLGLTDDGKQTCDFNNDKGVNAGEAIKAFTADGAYVTGDDTVLTGGMGETIAAGVSGMWNSDAIQGKLGANYGATKLPTFTCGGKQMQMGSFGGYKLIGVNSQTKFPADAMDLADWLTNEQNQVKRLEVRGYGPSNIKAATNSLVQKNLALAALTEQNKYATSQKDVTGSYWSPAQAFGSMMVEKDYSRSVKDMLDDMVTQITQ